MAAFVLPVAPPRTGVGSGGGGAPVSSPPRRRRQRPHLSPRVAAVVPVVRAAVAGEPEPRGGGCGGGGGGGGSVGSGRGGGSGGVWRGGAAEAGVGGGGAGERGAVKGSPLQTVGTSRLAAASGPKPSPRSGAVMGQGAAGPADGGGGGPLRSVAAAGDTTSLAVENGGDGEAAGADAPGGDPDSDGADGSRGMSASTSVWSGRKHTASARAKISAANRGRVPWNKGRQHSEETRARIAAATRAAMNRPDVRTRMAKKAGRKHTPETRAKIRATCTARFLASRKAAEAEAAVAVAAAAVTAEAAEGGGGGGGDGLDGGAPTVAATGAATKKPAAAAGTRRRASTARSSSRTEAASLPLSFTLETLPFSYDNATLGPQVLASLPRMLPDEYSDADLAGMDVGGSWLSAPSVGSDGAAAPAAYGSYKRGPLSSETRAKLSRRIRDMWANDPGYRARVTAGIATRAATRSRQLSPDHREAIRKSLLSRNAALRQQGVAHPSTRYVDGQVPSQRRRASRAAPPLSPEEMEAQAEARRQKRQVREGRRAARRAAREVQEASRRQSQKALVSQLVSAGSLPPLETLTLLDSWPGQLAEEGGQEMGGVFSGGEVGGAATLEGASAVDEGGGGGAADDSPDFDAIRAEGASLPGRLRGAVGGGAGGEWGRDVDGRERAGRPRGSSADRVGTADNGVAPVPVDVWGDGDDAGLPPERVLERIDYGDQLSWDLVTSPAPSSAGRLGGRSPPTDSDTDQLLSVAAAAEGRATDGAEEEGADADSEDDSDEEDWDEDEDEDEEEFDLTWEYEVEAPPRRAAPAAADAPVRRRILTYVDGAATMVDTSA